MINTNEVSTRISECKYFSELLSYLMTIDGIQGSHRFYANSELVELAGIVYEGVMPSVLTRSSGLRKKAMELSGKYSEDMIAFFCNDD